MKKDVLSEYILNFDNARPKNKDDKKNKWNVLNTAKSLYEGRELVIDFKSTTGTGLKILTSKQMLQRLLIALAQVKANNNLLNEIRQVVYSLCQSKEITKKVYNNIIKSIQIKTMGTVFMNCENSKTFEPHVLILKLTDKLDLRWGEKIIALSDLSIYYTWKNIKSSYNNNKFKISVPTWNDKFEFRDGSYFVSNIQDYFENILKKHGENMDKPSVKIYVYMYK